jgi:hypothetical protein
MKMYSIIWKDPVWLLFSSAKDEQLQFTYFDDLMEYLANLESEERS